MLNNADRRGVNRRKYYLTSFLPGITRAGSKGVISARYYSF